MDVIPAKVLDQVSDNCVEGLALALASHDDGAVMQLRWCNKAFCQITGYTTEQVVGQRGTILIGPDMAQGDHLHIIEELMNWSHFSIEVQNNRASGEKFRHRMTWTPLSDADTGDRYWLCSIIELEPATLDASQNVAPPPTITEQTVSASLTERIQSLERENARLYKLAKSVAKDANEDALTGLSNRRHFEVELKAWIERLHSQGRSFAVLYIDLDRFKFVNDTLGHDAGDRLLTCLLYTSDAADDLTRVDLGGCRPIDQKKYQKSSILTRPLITHH